MSSKPNRPAMSIDEHILTETEMNITKIALSCGYRDMSNFNCQFLRLKGVSPREFHRQMHQPG